MTSPLPNGHLQSQTSNYDIVIVGAGISGINFAYRLQERHPNVSYTILEGRDNIGGTWDLFKYPGIRSDSDLYTFGFAWRPWTETSSLAEGHLILKYLKESAEMYDIDEKIRFRHKVDSANWSSTDRRWTLDVNAEGQQKTFTCRFFLLCTGYYDYKTPLEAAIPGIDDFRGQVVHPQFWPKDLNYKDKDVVVIGSGATAVTLLPAMSKDAKHVTMLQRSPSYLLSQPREDAIERFLRFLLPLALSDRLIRIKYLIIPFLFVTFCRAFPTAARWLVRSATKSQLPVGMALDPDFNPTYNVFEQRLCFCKDGDFYEALRSGKTSIATGVIERVTKSSIKLTNGRELHPDIIVTATGLKIQLAGGIHFTVDGVSPTINEKFYWKNMMIQDVPNLFNVVGYVDNSWTLGADATARTFCRMLTKMEKEGRKVVVPRLKEDHGMKEAKMFNLSSTYVQKAKDILPKAGDHPQWRGRSSYVKDNWEAWFGDIETDVEYL